MLSMLLFLWIFVSMKIFEESKASKEFYYSWVHRESTIYRLIFLKNNLPNFSYRMYNNRTI